MRLFRSALLYLSLGLGANTLPGFAVAADIATLETLREGTIKKLVFHTEPKPTSDKPFTLADGAGAGHLADYKGKYVLLNFWATWCAPCRKEMPMLSELQSDFGGDDFEVVTLATGRNSPSGIKKFFAENNIDNLPRHQDPKQAIARDMAVLGLPITVILDPEGQEIARLRGDADWNSDSARAIIATLLSN